MKKTFIFFYLITISTFSQTKELCDIAFSKKENFEILKIFKDKIPNKFEIIDSTETWNPKTFYLENTNLDDQNVMKEINKDEHHPYHFAYLFADKSLNKLIENSEKVKLSKVAIEIKSKKISLKGENYETVKEFNKKKGFYFLITEPIYSTNRNYAFLDISIKKKDKFLGEKIDDYFGNIIIMFLKNENGNWEQIGIKRNVIL